MSNDIQGFKEPTVQES